MRTTQIEPYKDTHVRMVLRSGATVEGILVSVVTHGHLAPTQRPERFGKLRLGVDREATIDLEELALIVALGPMGDPPSLAALPAERLDFKAFYGKKDDR